MKIEEKYVEIKSENHATETILFTNNLRLELMMKAKNQHCCLACYKVRYPYDIIYLFLDLL